jgi:hypothetical protein
MPKYDIDKIKFGTDEGSFLRAVALYEAGKVENFQKGIQSFTATVIGTIPYKVFVEDRRFDYGRCTCYLGQNDTLCKHLIALAIFAVKSGKPLTDEEKKYTAEPACSGELGVLNAGELSKKKREVTHALRYIKGYIGPSRLWFAYQNSLTEGCRRLATIISSFPVSKQTADVLVNLLLRLDKKLCEGGVDDSDGTVGGFMESVVGVLQDFAKLDADCTKSFVLLAKRQTCFGWEAPLMKIFDENAEN